MAIYHASMTPISRSSGRSAVAAAAYRAGVELVNVKDGETHDFTRKQGVVGAEIVLPRGSDAAWALDRSALWNAAEAAERRKDARTAREITVALPHELRAPERAELAQDFAQGIADRYGVAVDVALHEPHAAGDVRNHHAHLLMTTRVVLEGGLGAKSDIERQNGELLAEGLPTSHMQLKELRQAWEDVANAHLAQAGHDLRIDCRSHEARGLEIEPTEHRGVQATQMDRRGLAPSRRALEPGAGARNAALIQRDPGEVLRVITAEKSVFDRHDVARALNRMVDDDAPAFQRAFAAVMASDALVMLQEDRGEELARYSTRDVVELEGAMADAAERMAGQGGYAVAPRRIRAAMERQDQSIREGVTESLAPRVSAREMTKGAARAQAQAAGLSDEQRDAVAHLAGQARIAAVVGFAGAGKSTLLAAAREAWTAQGLQVYGGALSAKATGGLEDASGIESRTVASWFKGWENGQGKLSKADVLVIDEAGMIGSEQMARLVNAADQAGAKLVLVGDHEQLQAIGAGAAFRALVERVSTHYLTEVRRQKEDWQRAASRDFATDRTAAGLKAYRERGAVRIEDTGEAALARIVADYSADQAVRPEGSRLVLAHRRADVAALNAAIRADLQARGALAEDATGTAVATKAGQRVFVPGDRIVFLEGERDLGVKNGSLGTVERAVRGRLTVRLDGESSSIEIRRGAYDAMDHGYATTIHKSQGATVDRAFVLASPTMDRHLTYVAMTRHREAVGLYAAAEDFQNGRAGRLVAHGAAPYQWEKDGRESYFVTLETRPGARTTIWGVNLERAMAEAAPKTGERLWLKHEGSDPVILPGGGTGKRHRWSVVAGTALTETALIERLSRSGAKETTLDYAPGDKDRAGFADRRGLLDRLGVTSLLRFVGLGADEAEARGLREPGKGLRQPPALERTSSAAQDATAGPHRLRQPSSLTAPLLPALTNHIRSVEAEARDAAIPVVHRQWSRVPGLARQVFTDHERVAAALRQAAETNAAAGREIAEQLFQDPEAVGTLRGKQGWFKPSQERKGAMEALQPLANTIKRAALVSERALNAEMKLEHERRRNDERPIPGLSKESLAVLKSLAGASVDDASQILATDKGRKACSEAEALRTALKSRFCAEDGPALQTRLDRVARLSPGGITAQDLRQVAEEARVAHQVKTVEREFSRTRERGRERGRERDDGYGL